MADFGLGLVKMLPTIASDVLGGQTTFVEGNLRVGEGTVHSTITLFAGLIPETHFQLYANSKQFSYDINGILGTGDLLDVGVYDVKAVEIEIP